MLVIDHLTASWIFNEIKTLLSLPTEEILKPLMYLQDTKLFLHTLIFLLRVAEHDSAAPAVCCGLTYILSLVFTGKATCTRCSFSLRKPASTTQASCLSV